MQSNKEISAEESYKKFLDIMLYDVPLIQLDELVVKDVTGYGTTLDEKILEIERLRKLIIDQREQGAGYEINFVVNPVHRRKNPDNGLAVFIDEIEVTMSINGNKNIIPLRFSSVLELINGSWKVVHLHGSVAVNTEGDTWHKEEHLRKIEELEKLVSEKTEDLVKKNRELEIESALEKVRSSALTMKQPGDMVEVCRIISDQLHILGISNIRNVQTVIINEQKGMYLNYEYYAAYKKGVIEDIDYNKHPTVYTMVVEMKKSANSNFNGSMEGEELISFRKWRKKDNQFPDPLLDEVDSVYYYFYSIGLGGLGLTTYKILQQAGLEIFKRFHNVFTLAYRRFIDIEKAIAQARESQIELALERVRARTTAMQKSEELKEVIQAVYEQFINLKINVDHAGFVIDFIPKGDWHFWIADEQDIPSKITHPYFESVWANQFNEAKEKGFEFFTTNLNFEEKNKFYNELLSHVHGLPKVSKDFYLSCPGLAISTVLLENVSLYIENFSGTPYSDEVNATLVRFGKVFQQTYTRFLDLQKAEAQAREAEIQLALERVRARSLAMHHTTELQEVVNILAQQLHNMNLDINGGVFIAINDEVDTDIPLWASGGAADYVQKVTVPFLNKPVFIKLRDAIKRKNNFFTEEHSHKEKIELFKHLFKYPPWDSHSQHRKQELFSREGGYTRSVAISHYTSISITNHNGKKFSDEDNEILKRFGNVFEQSYIRFLDLQKAEAQAREAKIEAALEKVRSKTMAMQSSDELADTAAVVFQQLINLGIEPNRIYITIIKDESGTCEFWITDEDGSKVSSVFRMNLNENNSFKKMYAGWIQKKKSITIDMQGEELQEYFKQLSSLNVPFKGGLTQKRRLQYIAYFSKGFIGVVSPDETKFESIQLLERFAAVFNLTYTRFNDLKQAEAQNKIIQAANDRKTKELEEARQLQLSMLPKELPKLSNLEIAVYMKTATEVGGDYYDFNVTDDGTLTVAVGDATGHGMKAGTIVSMTKALFTSGGSRLDMKTFFNQINDTLKGIELGRLMMGFMMLKIKSNKLEFANAGMPPLFIYRKQSKEVEELMLNGMPLGAMRNFPYEIKELEISSDDTILLLSDGLPELKNEKHIQFGYEKVKNEFKSVAEKNPDEIVEHLKNSATQWINGIEPDDDVTLVVLKIK
jgi:hypothetical protein